jgi:autotransporter-associated beta strand protein
VISLFGAAAFVPSAAFAGCSPATGDNVTVACSGATLDQGPGINTGYGDGTQNGLTINVVAGPPPASVTGTSIGIDVGDNNTINNFGTITTAGNGAIGDVWGINAGGNLTVVNSGTIGRLDIPDNLFDSAGINSGDGLSVTNKAGATIQGVVGIQGVGTGTVVNSGLITGLTGGGGEGIDFAANNTSMVTVTNNAGGTITGDAFGINANSAVVYNYGTISAPTSGNSGTGLNANTLVLTNYSTGLITGDGFGVSGSQTPNLTITNFGTISATGLFGIGVQGNVVNITNSGTISAASGGGGFEAVSMTSGSVTNNAGGLITSDAIAIMASGNTSIFNAGTITGSGGTAILFFSGGNTLTLAPGSVINGTAQGFGADTFQLGGTGADTFDVNLFASQFSGYSTFNKIGASTWTLTGATAAVTPWTINQGTLAISSDGGLGAASGALTFTGGTLETTATFSLTHAINLGVAGGTISTDAGTTLTATGTITGASGALTKTGAGTLLLSGNNTYGGGTTISAGTLQLGVDSVFNVVGQPSSGIVSSAIGKGTLTFDGGTLQSLPLSERAIANAIQITANGGTIDSGSGFFRITGDITDAPGSIGGRLTFESIAGAGLREVALSGNDTYSGITYIDSGTVIANSTTALSLNSAFEVNTGATLTLSSFSNSIASLADGNAGGGVVQNASASGTATLTITGASGATTSFSGVLRDGTGGEGGAGGPVLAIVKDGPGTQILAGINHYTGTTTVNGGVLEVDGSIAPSSLTTVNAGATLTGSGTVGNTAITGGTLAPGSAGGSIFGPLTVQGTLSLTAASTYMIQVSPANAGRTNVTGGATLGGATVNAVFLPGSYVSKQYIIVNATGGLGGSTFNPTVVSNMSNLQSSLSYDGNDAYLNVRLNFTPPSGNLNVNQQNVANALTGFFNRTGGIPAAFAALSPAGLTQASGEVATGSQQTTFDAMNLFMGLLTDPFIAGRGDGATGGAGATPFAEADDGANAYAANGKARSKSERDAYAAVYTKAPPVADPFAQRWSVWAAGYGGSQTTDGNAALGSNTATSRIAGTAVGADYRFSPFTLAGFALAGGATNFSLANGLGSGRSDLFQAGAFVHHTVGPAYISAALAYGWQDITTDRTVTIAGVDQLRAQFNANAYSGRVEGGYRFVTPWMGGVGLTPYAAGQFTTFDLPAYAEQALSGANTFALAYNSQSVTDTRSELGLRTDKSYALQDGIFTLRGRFAWAHDYNPDRNIAATFQTLPGASFVVNGAAQAHDSALTTASAEMKWTNGWSAAATFEGEFSEVTQSYAGKGVVRYAW